VTEQAEVRVLVVEDDPGIAGSLVRGLTRAGYQADTVGTAAEALAAGPAEVVLLDLGLPDVDGMEVCAALPPSWSSRRAVRSPIGWRRSMPVPTTIW